MANAMGEEFFFYPADSKKKREELKPYLEKQGEETGKLGKTGQRKGQQQGQTGKKATEPVSLFGIKMSYAKAFGIAFLIIFLLLFFPGIGVSSSSVSDKSATTDRKKGDPKENKTR
ncbi:MAG TPA: hypothetical protein GX395_04750 [Clostridia bacterium]|jgi:hypothetical protein|nr:hypothetical protein [Clostridia bacterium]